MRNLLIILFLSTVLASGCVSSQDSVEEDHLSYTAPEGFELTENDTAEWGYNYTFTTYSEDAVIDVSKVEIGQNRTEYLNTSKTVLEFSSASVFEGNITGSRVDRNSEHGWTEVNGTYRVNAEEVEIRAREHLFSAYHENNTYRFKLTAYQIGNNTPERNYYKDFRKSVKNSEFK